MSYKVKTLSKLAEILGITQNTVRNWMRKRPPMPHEVSSPGRYEFDAYEVLDWVFAHWPRYRRWVRTKRAELEAEQRSASYEKEKRAPRKKATAKRRSSKTKT